MSPDLSLPDPSAQPAAGDMPGTFPTEVVVRWLRSRGVDLMDPVTAMLIAGGRSNLTYILTAADGHRVVLRRPPFDGVLETAHDMGREWRLISALRGSGVPVPDALAVADGPEPLGVPFYVMSHVDGVVLHDAAAAEALAPPARHRAAAELVDTMATLHAVDIDEVGLGGMAKREDYLLRQLRRWKRQFDQSTSTDVTAVDAAYEKLRQRVPPQRRTSIVHGDLRLGNTICGPDGYIRAVLDWELCTLGDPLADLGWLLSSWVAADEWVGTPMSQAPPSVLPGFPSRKWLQDRYEQRTAADLTEFNIYLAFSHWRSACISAGVLTRYQSGAMAQDGFDPVHLRDSIVSRAESALSALG